MRKLTRITCLMIVCLAIVLSPSVDAEVNELRFPIGAGGVGFLPLLVMQKYGLIEQYAKEAGIGNLHVRWINIGGPAVMNDALLSGSADFIAAGPPAFLTLWDRTVSSAKVKGVAAMTSLPMVSQHAVAGDQEAGRYHRSRPHRGDRHQSLHTGARDADVRAPEVWRSPGLSLR